MQSPLLWKKSAWRDISRQGLALWYEEEGKNSAYEVKSMWYMLTHKTRLADDGTMTKSSALKAIIRMNPRPKWSGDVKQLQIEHEIFDYLASIPNEDEA